MSGLVSNNAASCGSASNPLLSFQKHTEASSITPHFANSTQPHDQIRGRQQKSQFNTSNRFTKIDDHLEREFQTFSSNGGSSHQAYQAPNVQFQAPAHHQLHQSNIPTFQGQQGQHQQQSNTWTAQFANLSLNQTASVQQHGWNQEYQQQQPRQMPNQLLNTTPIHSMNLLPAQQHGFMTEHQELHHAQTLNESEISGDGAKFDKIFDQIESQLLKPEAQNEVKNEIDYDRERFAATAKLVANAMNSKTSQNTKNQNLTSKKFENSKFLKLMNQVSNKSVVINDKGDGFTETDEYMNVNANSI